MEAESAPLEIVCAAGRPAEDAREASVFSEFAASDPHLNTAVDRALIGGTDIDLPVNAVAPCDDTVKKNILSPLNRRCQHRITTSSSLTELH